MLRFVPIADVDADAIEQLLDRAFGTDRHGRTAYAVRDGTEAIPTLSFAALDEDDALVGSIQCWPVALAPASGDPVPMTMVGPVAVDPPRQQAGIGHALVAHMLKAAHRLGADRARMLIGDPEYYGRFFGFTSERTGEWQLPGPVLRHRLLARGPDVPAMAGMLRANIAVSA
ncbi:MAG: GNAT family N-acetyltransferase [Sphingomonas sp.]